MSWPAVAAAWRKWLADLSNTRTQIVVVLLGLHIWAWADVLLRPHSPTHVVELVRITAPVSLAGLLAWAGAKTVGAIYGVYGAHPEVPEQDRGGD